MVGNSLGCEDVNALIVILLFRSSVRLSSAEYDVTPPRIPHAKRLEGHGATPEIRSSQPCAFMSFICGCMQVGGRCPRADFFFFFSERTLGDTQVERIKKTSLPNEIWRGTETRPASGCKRLISLWIRYTPRLQKQSPCCSLLANTHIFYKGSTGSTRTRLLMWYTDRVFVLNRRAKFVLLCVRWREVRWI